MIYTTDIIGDQWNIFIKSVSLGILLGGCFIFMRMGFIILQSGRKILSVFDFLFWIWGGFIVFSFLLNENFGIPRLYIFIGIGAGFAALYFAAGKTALKAAKVIGKIIRKILSPFIRIYRKTAGKRIKELKINSLKLAYNRKRLLKKKAGLVYNILCLNISKAFSFCGEKAGKEPEKVESTGTEKSEKEHFSQDCSYCLRGISSVLSDSNAGEYKRKTDRT